MIVMKRVVTTGLLLLGILCAKAQGPNNSGIYYQGAEGKKGAELKTALYSIIKTHVERDYNDLWTDFLKTDMRSDGKVWDMYSNITSYVFGEKQGGTYSGEGDSYNREHSFPKSWFNNGTPMYTDLFHLYPVDGWANSVRNNFPYGEVGTVTNHTANNFSLLGKGKSDLGYNKTVFEPNDEYKGDFARTYFYMATCYEDKISGWETGHMLNGTSYPAFSAWALQMLLKWAAQDPVSEKEINRNNAVYGIQHNRNPFIDYPGLERMIWGDLQDQAFDYNNDGVISGGDNPPPSTGIQFVKTTTVESGKHYLIVADNNGSLLMAKPVAADKNYNWLYVDNVTATSDVITRSDLSTAFLFTSVAGGYTITQADGRSLYQTESYNNFNVTENPTEGHVWSVVANADGTVAITNTALNKWMQYSVKYQSFGSYPSAQDHAILPSLYVESSTTGISRLQGLPHTSDVYTISGQRVNGTLQKGIYIRGGNKFVVK